MTHRIAEVNGQPSLLAYKGGVLHSILSLDVVGGRIHSICIQGDPKEAARPGLSQIGAVKTAATDLSFPRELEFKELTRRPRRIPASGPSAWPWVG